MKKMRNAAIDEGIRDAKAGRVMPAEKARQLLPKWITNSSTSPKNQGQPESCP
jgi:predicted transcriptional regulator